MVNIQGKKQGSFAQKRVNRSTTHIRVKKQDKFALERFMKKHHINTYSKALRRLLEEVEGSSWIMLRRKNS